ncbi:MAG TPA: diguanylate cyclase [Armatimonadota bacterium]|nr:diguanylate cyclase [Armatimonadota bacterium]
MKILIADDELVSRHLMKAALRDMGYDVVVVDNGQDAWEVLQEGEARIALIDWVMPGLDGIEICRRVREAGMLGYVYVIVVTGRDQTEDVVAALDAGADDCVTKPFRPEELSARVRTGIRIVMLERALRETQDELRLIATRDELTKVWNRPAILRLLEGEVNRSRREYKPFAIALVDIDHFKQVNDRLGHLAGDVVLAEVASRLTSACRSYDRVGRYGGEEMVVLMPGCESDAAFDVSERLRCAVSACDILTPEGAASVTVSVGAASNQDRLNVSSTVMVRAADRALYESKGNGRNRVTIATLAHWE